MTTVWPASAAEPTPTAKTTHCAQCAAELALLSIIPGRGGVEYWTLRCTACGNLHLDIVEPATAEASKDSQTAV